MAYAAAPPRQLLPAPRGAFGPAAVPIPMPQAWPSQPWDQPQASYSSLALPCAFAATSAAMPTQQALPPQWPKACAPQQQVLSSASDLQMPPPPPEPLPPPFLTEGLQSPTSIETRRAKYSRSLDEQAKKGTEMLDAQKKQQIESIYKAAEQLKSSIQSSPWKGRLIWQIDQLARQQDVQLGQKYSQSSRNLQQAYEQQKHALDVHANELALDYQWRRSQEDTMKQQYEMQKMQYDFQMQTIKDMREMADAEAKLFRDRWTVRSRRVCC
mmetsp:Transcript_67484/g.149525  ORF Transcript_67484/g.149525 Transcript_67484/m.149525 type:complete len:269 (+) Transcript_67484:86-892(+)